MAGIFRSFSEGSITKRGATVRCVTPVKLVRVEGKPFRDFLRNSSSVVYESVQKELLSRLKSRNIKTNVKMMQMICMIRNTMTKTICMGSKRQRKQKAKK